MKTFFVFAVLAVLSSQTYAFVSPEQYNGLNSLQDDVLKSQLHDLLAKDQKSLGYKGAKKAMFQSIDNHDGEVCGVYSETYCMRTKVVPSHTKMNAEHTWPQSMGAVGVAKSDLHHLYPTQSTINSTRSNYPFCEVQTIKWQGQGSKMGRDANGTQCFEPPLEHKGNVARSMFYFAVRYGHNIDSAQEKILRKWNDLDPVDQAERDREQAIENYQHNTNLFVLHPGLVNRIDDL